MLVMFVPTFSWKFGHGKSTAVLARNAKTKIKPYKLSDGYGLHFHVAKSGKKTWRYLYKIAGTESTYVLGEYQKMTLEQARKVNELKMPTF